jgi:predicted nuclease with TOPRIM domain
MFCQLYKQDLLLTYSFFSWPECLALARIFLKTSKAKRSFKMTMPENIKEMYKCLASDKEWVLGELELLYSWVQECKSENEKFKDYIKVLENHTFKLEVEQARLKAENSALKAENEKLRGYLTDLQDGLFYYED